MTDLQKLYKEIKTHIDSRLNEFCNLWQKGNDADIFTEMCFCTCTPQNNAQKAWDAALTLKKSDCLKKDTDEKEVAGILRERGVRFHKNKAKYIIINKNNFAVDTKKKIKKIIEDSSIIDARNILHKNVAGWGLKETSHFLRNIGYGKEICILDRHIMRQLVEYKIIKEIPKTITTRCYHNTEQLMINFAKSEIIPVDALDLLFWYKEKNELFK